VFAVSQFGPILSTRSKGVRAAEALSVFAAEHDGLVEVSFAGCKVASPPFMQELTRACRSLGDRIIYSCLNEDVNATLTYVEATWRRLA
jgi:hypothetical protein